MEERKRPRKNWHSACLIYWNSAKKVFDWVPKRNQWFKNSPDKRGPAPGFSQGKRGKDKGAGSGKSSRANQEEKKKNHNPHNRSHVVGGGGTVREKRDVEGTPREQAEKKGCSPRTGRNLHTNSERGELKNAH